jgi:hypothetical protein
MIARIALDVVSGPVRPIALILAGMFAGMIVLEGGILAAFGMRPVGKAFTSAFLANMAACGTGFVFGMIAQTLNLEGTATMIVAMLGAIAVQGFFLGKNPVNLTTGRAWIAAVVMKSSSFALILLLFQFTDL